jgi:hypothetical protein
VMAARGRSWRLTAHRYRHTKNPRIWMAIS